MKKKVYVGMSGGVDSSVSAALLKQKGYDVTGVFIKVWQPDTVACTWKEDRLDAMRVAAHLDIPFLTLDLEKEYKEEVIDYMIEEYRSGCTPNPDVMCNKFVKFGAFYDWAISSGAEYVATGHYARHDGASLTKSEDENKDQTYFLWALSREIIPQILFPIGDIEKPHVRKLAVEFGLPVAKKKDSQGLCFVGTINVKTLLKNYIEEKEGDVINEKGEVIGSHEGVTFYTIGERHGFVVTKKGIEEKPYFVIGKDLKKNTLTVSHTKKEEASGDLLILKNINWTQEIVKGRVYEGRARYRAPLAQLEAVDNKTFKVKSGEIVAVKGQSLVLYDGEKCIGGGILM